MKHLLHIFIIVTLFFEFTTTDHQPPTEDICNTALAPKYKQEKCLGTWFMYASSEQCDDCCFIRELALVRPGVLNMTDTIHKLGESEPTVKNYISTRTDANLTFALEDHQRLIIDGNCHEFVTLKVDNKPIMATFIRQIQPLFTPRIPECNIKMYNYKPEETCLQYI